MTRTCLLHQKAFRRMEDELRGYAAEVDFITMDDEGVFANGFTGEPVSQPVPDMVFGNTDFFFGPKVRAFFRFLIELPDLDWFQSSAAGMDNETLQAVHAKARLYTTNHTQSEAMAEWAIWQALDWLKAGRQHRAQEKEAEWQRIYHRDFIGSKWLIVGYGAIGQAVARRVKALGGLVTGVRRSGGTDDYADTIVTPEEMGPALRDADITLLCLPHTPETENMADADFFAAIKDDAMFMNLGRGALVDEAALIAEMDRGKPAFAALDVTATEPLPEASPLWRHPNIAITPHDSSLTLGTFVRADETFLANLKRYLAGEELIHLAPK